MSIADANSASYTPEADYAGDLLRVSVAYTDASGSGRMAGIEATERVDQLGTVAMKSRNPMVNVPEVGVWQEADITDPDELTGNEVWQWEVSPHGVEAELTWSPISSAQSKSYKPIHDDAGKLLRIAVMYNHGAGDVTPIRECQIGP